MQTLIITGASGGLGSEVVRALSGTYDIRALHFDLANLAAVHDGIRAIAAETGPPYGLLHLAGGFALGSIAETTDETWAKMLALNLTAAFVVLRETLAVMDREGDGRIIAIGSAATLTKTKGNIAYTVAKSGLNVLIELAAKELHGTRITVNAILPTALDTPAMREVAPRETLVPLNRVTDTIAFLLSSAAANISGALIPLTGR
jgi:NAD(P)-dependent dehydrogenase (short-subunit alcohol dehydrogenase family)